VRLDSLNGTIEVLVPEHEWNAREPATADLSAHHSGMGRELFGLFRNAAGTADLGAGVF
jgi:phosphogluconate dehydratase